MRTKKLLLFLLSAAKLYAYDYDFIVEGKGAYFLPTDSKFSNIFHGSGIYGAEVTGRIWKNLYAFASADFFNKRGKTVSFDTPTRINIINIGAGLKYLVPFFFGDFYIGLGALPTRLHTHDFSPYIIQKRTKWGCGGIAKVGTYFNLPASFVIDLFVDYSFVKIHFDGSSSLNIPSQSARLNGCWFGGGVGYRFN